MATRTDEKPSHPVSISLEHVVETIFIPAHRTNTYLIEELVLVNLFCHDIAMSFCIINPFRPDKKLLAMQGFKELE
jgi:hypothetical protein